MIQQAPPLASSPPDWGILIDRYPAVRPQDSTDDAACCAHAMRLLARWQAQIDRTEPQHGDDRDRVQIASAEIYKALCDGRSEALRRCIGVLLDLDILPA